MVEITVKIKVSSDDIDEAEDWLEELSGNEMFTYDVIEIKKV